MMQLLPPVSMACGIDNSDIMIHYITLPYLQLKLTYTYSDQWCKYMLYEIQQIYMKIN